MSMYAVKNDKGKYLDKFKRDWTVDICCCWSGVNDADETANDCGGHVVELVEKPEPVEVSEAEAEMLAVAVNEPDKFPVATNISGYVKDHKADYGDCNRALIEDLIVRAYVNGWTVKQPKRWNVKVPKSWGAEGVESVFAKKRDGRGIQGWGSPDNFWPSAIAFTDNEIDQYGLQECDKVEVRDEEQA